MKIKELFHLDKSLKAKRQELEKLKKETEALRLTIKSKNDEISRDKIDIKDVYVYQNIESNVRFFVQKKRNTKLYDNNFPLVLINIFTDEIVTFLYNSDFIRAQSGYNTKFTIRHIGNVHREVNAYPNNMVPRTFLQELYCRESNAREYEKNTEKENPLEEEKREPEKLGVQLLSENNKDCPKNLIDISDIYVYVSSINHPIHFIKLIVKENLSSLIKLIDVFSEKEINCCNRQEFLDSQDRILTENSSKFMFSTKHIKKVYPELNDYLDNMVPKEILEELLYRINSRDEDNFKYKIKK